MQESVLIKIKNCNCIKSANIEIKKGLLNIKYGQNGTGKSTISEAIFDKVSNKMDNLLDLLPYGADATKESETPRVENVPFSKIRVFNESYVNQYLFQGDSFFEDSFQVFLKSNECDTLARNIEILLKDLQGVFQKSEEIYGLISFLPKYFELVKYNDGAVSKKGGIGEFIKGNGSGFEQYSELDDYQPFYKNRDFKVVSNWAKWRNDGIKQVHGENCPFCTKNMDEEKIKSQNKVIAKVFKNSALSTANDILQYLKAAVDLNYVKENSIKILESYIGDSNKSDELYAELQQIAIETDYLYGKIQKIWQFKPMNVTHKELISIEKNLDDMVIESRQILKFYGTKLIFDMVKDVSEAIKNLKKNTGKLKGLFLAHENKLEELINLRRDDINQFFTLAGFPYEFELKQDGEKKAITYLVSTSCKTEAVKKPQNRLSWGEKNAFALVMFMFEAISDESDLIVLDDPISAFDENKKFAVVRRLFDNQKASFRDKTVLLLTHDIQPIIDYIHGRFFIKFGLTTKVNANYLQNENGIICEYPITENDLVNTVDLTKSIATNSNMKLHLRIVNLRKYIELVKPNFRSEASYEVLSNIIHGRVIAEDKDQNKLPEQIFKNGCFEIQAYINEYTYDDYIEQLSTSNLLKLVKLDNSYEKIIAIRLLFERIDNLLLQLRRVAPAACKFLNETNHIENDYIFQLNPLKFFDIPDCYLKDIECFLTNNLELEKEAKSSG